MNAQHCIAADYESILIRDAHFMGCEQALAYADTQHRDAWGVCECCEQHYHAADLISVGPASLSWQLCAHCQQARDDDALTPGIQSFLQRLADKKPTNEWHKGTYGGKIRLWHGRSLHCPLTYLARQEYGLELDERLDWELACAPLGLTLYDGSTIVSAADKAERHNPALRLALLQALGLPLPA